MIQDGKLRGFAMGQAIAVRTDYMAGEVRRFAQRAKDAAQARRLLAIAAVLDGASREEAATIGEAMQLHLDEIATKVALGAHAIILLDQAGWHGAKALVVP